MRVFICVLLLVTPVFCLQNYSAAKISKIINEQFGIPYFDKSRSLLDMPMSFRNDKEINNFINNLYNDMENIDKIERKRQVAPLLVKYAPDPNPRPFIIPVNASTIKLGYVTINTLGFPNLVYDVIAYEGLRTMEYIINTNGGVNIADEIYYVEIIALYGGPDCNDFLILYEYLITEAKIDYMIHPTSTGCPELALLAEAYKIVNMNSNDFVLSVLSVSIPPFNNLTYTYSLTVNYSISGQACLKPLVDKGAKTYAVYYDVLTAGVVIPGIEATADAFGMTKIIDDTILDPDVQAKHLSDGDKCGYFDNLFKQITKHKPDMLIGSFGIYIDNLIDCMHRYKHKYYNPPAMWLISGSYFQNDSLWQVEGTVVADYWVPNANFTDPYLVNVAHWNQVYNSIWVNDTFHYSGFPPTIGVCGTLLFNALANTNGTDIIAGLNSNDLYTVVGRLFLIPGTHVYDHPFYCSQRINATNSISGSVIYPYDTLGVVDTVFPYEPFIFPQSFRDELKIITYWKRHKIGIIVGSVLGFVTLLVIIGVTIYVIKSYSVLFIEDTGLQKTSEW
jgi:hypothetical protein